MQVINHGSVHHAGFLSERAIYALSHDEVFSIHPATDPDEQAQEPDPLQFGDLREPLGCEYIAQLCIGSQGPYIAAGNKMYATVPSLFSPCTCNCLLRLAVALFRYIVGRRACMQALTDVHREKRLDLVPLVAGPTWRFDQENLWRLPGGHGEEIVRSVYLDEQVRLAFSLPMSSVPSNINSRMSSRNQSLPAEKMDSCARGKQEKAAMQWPWIRRRRRRGRRRRRIRAGSSLISALSGLALCTIYIYKKGNIRHGPDGDLPDVVLRVDDAGAIQEALLSSVDDGLLL